jgi:hypothetical protein
MKEHFSLEIPRTLFVGNTLYFIISIFISVAIVYNSIQFKNMVMSIISILILTLLIYMILSSMMMTHTGLSLHSTTYPLPPHLGLDGISVQNQVDNQFILPYQNL